MSFLDEIDFFLEGNFSSIIFHETTLERGLVRNGSCTFGKQEAATGFAQNSMAWISLNG